MAQTELEQRIIAALEERAEPEGIDIVDVEIVGAAGSPVVRVRIDHADESLPTISLDEVTAQGAWVEEVIDEVDPFEGSFVLEVSSPGLARPLRRQRDFARFAGERVQVTLHKGEGRRRFTGVLLGIEDDVVRLSVDDGTVEIPFDDIRSAKVKPSFD